MLDFKDNDYVISFSGERMLGQDTEEVERRRKNPPYIHVMIHHSLGGSHWQHQMNLPMKFDCERGKADRSKH